MIKSQFELTTKNILDFYQGVLNYNYTNMDDKIYKDVENNTYFQVSNIYLDIPKNQLSSSRWITITEDLLNRPDKIAYVAYGEERLAWVVMQHNGITNPFDMELGQIIEIPSLGEVTKAIQVKRSKLKL
jgi:hypothetical protein